MCVCACVHVHVLQSVCVCLTVCFLYVCPFFFKPLFPKNGKMRTTTSNKLISHSDHQFFTVRLESKTFLAKAK